MPNALDFAKKIIDVDNFLGYRPLNKYEKRFKVVVFVPGEMVNIVSFAMAEAGAGKIGNYKVCSFRIPGKGTFIGGSRSNPSVGSREKLETVDEVRLEMVCDSKMLDDVIGNVLEVHPYEEPAYEIYEIISGEKIPPEKAVQAFLIRPAAIGDLIKKLNRKIDSEFLKASTLKKKIKSLVINFTRCESLLNIGSENKSGILFIHKLRTGEYKISFK